MKKTILFKTMSVLTGMLIAGQVPAAANLGSLVGEYQSQNSNCTVSVGQDEQVLTVKVVGGSTFVESHQVKIPLSALKQSEDGSVISGKAYQTISGLDLYQGVKLFLDAHQSLVTVATASGPGSIGDAADMPTTTGDCSQLVKSAN